ncbi:MAG TPA: V-type ATPase 116kDa subunit family protein [Myxococcaceae bacterium]|nr:V-type ATPase 116kDa subunit family protein [Myxococcaceae bacterium]
MIRAMRRVRVMGPRRELEGTLRVLQDLGSMHLGSPPRLPALNPSPTTRREQRLVRQLRALVADAETARTLLDLPQTPVDSPPPVPAPWPSWARQARQLRRRAEQLRERRQRLEEERALLGKYREMLDAFSGLFEAGRLPAAVRAYHIVLRPGQASVVEPLRQALAEALDSAFELRTRTLSAGDTALLLLVPLPRTGRVERLLGESGVQEVPLPAGYERATAVEALPRMRARLDALPALLEEVDGERKIEAAVAAGALPPMLAAAQDAISRLEAVGHAASTRTAFILEGWVPAPDLPELGEALRQRIGPEITVEELPTAPDVDAPVVLQNPRLFRPFQLLVEMLPLPTYGSIDPTPFVAVFFPVFFGLMVGDIGYGVVMLGLGVLLHRRSRPGTPLHAVAQIALVCSVFTVIFGVLFGELFGDAGRRVLGLHPLVLDREEPKDIVSFLILCVGIGGVHVLLGLVLGVFNAMHGHHRRQALGRGLSAVMILLVVVALLAAVKLLPAQFLTPTVVALLVAFPLLIIAEGIVAPVELLATMGNILSYARIMALGTASVMLAVVANRLAGAMGSVVVGAIFALLFHLVNFALGLFSPTVHALRLHYVEFFGRFYSPGGVRYRPFTHWRTH